MDFVAFQNGRLGHRQQLFREGIELLKFFRRTAHLASMIALLIFGFAAIAVAQTSQPPVPSPAIGSQAQQQQPNTNGSNAQPAQTNGPGITITNAPVIAFPESNPQQKRAERQDDTASNRWIAIATWVLAGLTFALVYVGWKQRQTYEATLATNKDIERAYISPSHVHPGLIVKTNGTSVSVKIQIKNSGMTPAYKEHYNYDTEIDENGQPKKERKGWRYYAGLSR